MQVAADPAAETADKPKEAPATAIRRGGRTRRTTMQVESDAEAEPGPATAEPEATEAPEPAQKRRGRPPKAQAAAAAQEGGEVAAAQKNPRERTTSKRGKSPAAAEQPEAAVAEPEPEPEPDVVEQPDARDDATPTPTPTGEAMQVEKATADKGAEMDALPDIAAPADSEPSAHDRDADIEPAGTVDAAEDDIEEAPDVTVEVFLRAFCEKQIQSLVFNCESRMSSFKEQAALARQQIACM